MLDSTQLFCLVDDFFLKFKAVCQKALKDGIISGFISADVPGEGAMHIEIMQ